MDVSAKLAFSRPAVPDEILMFRQEAVVTRQAPLKILGASLHELGKRFPCPPCQTQSHVFPFCHAEAIFLAMGGLQELAPALILDWILGSLEPLSQCPETRPPRSPRPRRSRDHRWCLGSGCDHILGLSGHHCHGTLGGET